MDKSPHNPSSILATDADEQCEQVAPMETVIGEPRCTTKPRFGQFRFKEEREDDKREEGPLFRAQHKVFLHSGERGASQHQACLGLYSEGGLSQTAVGRIHQLHCACGCLRVCRNLATPQHKCTSNDVLACEVLVNGSLTVSDNGAN